MHPNKSGKRRKRGEKVGGESSRSNVAKGMVQEKVEDIVCIGVDGEDPPISSEAVRMQGNEAVSEEIKGGEVAKKKLKLVIDGAEFDIVETSRNKNKYVIKQGNEVFSEEIEGSELAKEELKLVINDAEFEVVKTCKKDENDVETVEYWVDTISAKDRKIISQIEFDCLLPEWLELQDHIWCPFYERFKIYQPADEVRMLIRGLITAVLNLHSKGKYHGALEDLKNYAVHRPKRHTFSEYIEVSLLGRGRHTQSKALSFSEARKSDLVQLEKVIFSIILKGVEKSNYTPDLSHLQDLIRNTDEIEGNILQIGNHVSLWEWDERARHCRLAWKELMRNGEDSDIGRSIINSVVATGYDGRWDTLLPHGTPLARVVDGEVIDTTAAGFLQYLQFAIDNVGDQYRVVRREKVVDPFGKPVTDPTTGKALTRFRQDYQLKHITEGNPEEELYLDPQFVEMKITETYPLFLVRFHCQMMHEGKAL